MAKRTQTYIKYPWDGGVNTSVDSGMLNDNDLVIADNVVFATSGSRLKREGLDYVDSGVATVTARSSSGTTRTLYFKDADDQLIKTTPATDERLVVGEYIKVSTTGSGESDYVTASAKITSISTVTGGHTITYEVPASTLTESETTTTTITVKRASSVLRTIDYWYFNGTAKVQLLLAATNNFQLFKFDDSGRRVRIEAQPEVSKVTCQAASTLQASGAADYFLLYSANDDTSYYVWFDVDNGCTDPAPSGKTGVEVNVSAADTAAQVATKLQTAIDALDDFSATVDDDEVTITCAAEGATSDIADQNTGFTVATVTQGASAPDTAVSQINATVMNNRAIFALSGLGNKPIKYYPEASSKYEALGGDPPDFSVMCRFQSRLWANDKNDPDMLNYSSPDNPEEWQGVGDSGGLPLGIGDGDPEGITNIFEFKGILFVAKKNALYRVDGTTPEDYRVTLVSGGVGSEGPLAVSVDEADVLFGSKRGFHSVVATDTYGDTTAAFLSAKIQPTFNDWNQGRLKYIQGAYVPELNTVALGVSQTSTYNDTVWLFNTLKKEWHRWPNIPCEAVTTRQVNNETKLVFGTNDGRLIQAQNEEYTDFETSGISYRVKTGTVYPGGNPNSIKAFKKLGFLYRPKGNFQFTVRAKIDNYETQALTFEQEAGGDLLDVDFILGQSVLGSDNTLAPFTQQIDGYGRGITIEILQSGTDEQVEIYGFIIEYEEAGDSQETRLGSDA